MFEGFLALLLAYLFFWYLLYISKKKQSKQSLDGYSLPAYDLRFFPSTAAPAALCLFVLLLVSWSKKRPPLHFSWGYFLRQCWSCFRTARLHPPF